MQYSRKMLKIQTQQTKKPLATPGALILDSTSLERSVVHKMRAVEQTRDPWDKPSAARPCQCTGACLPHRQQGLAR